MPQATSPPSPPTCTHAAAAATVPATALGPATAATNLQAQQLPCAVLPSVPGAAAGPASATALVPQLPPLNPPAARLLALEELPPGHQAPLRPSSKRSRCRGRYRSQPTSQPYRTGIPLKPKTPHTCPNIPCHWLVAGLEWVNLHLRHQQRLPLFLPLPPSTPLLPHAPSLHPFIPHPSSSLPQAPPLSPRQSHQSSSPTPPHNHARPMVAPGPPVFLDVETNLVIADDS